MIFRQLFDPATSTFTYLLADPETREAVLVDPVVEQVDRDVALLAELGLRLVYTLDTHVHADHVTGAAALRERLGSEVVYPDGSGVDGADVLVGHGDVVRFGRYALEVRATPGHTDACVTYVTSDHRRAFTGDALLIRGSGRTDFQAGDARALYRSVHEQIFSLPDDTALYPGHDYKGRTVTTVGEERAHNPRLGGGRTEDDFVATMAALDLPYPKHIDRALPANQRVGRVDEGWPEVRGASGAVQVTPDRVATLGDDVRVLDVRELDEWNGELGHIDGAELAPLGTLPDRVGDWDRSAPVVVVCRSGGRSDRAALLLESLGFERVASMTGGMLRWRDLDLPVRLEGVHAA